MGTVSVSSAPPSPQALIATLKATGQLASSERQSLLEHAVTRLVLHLAELGIAPDPEVLEIMTTLVPIASQA